MFFSKIRSLEPLRGMALRQLNLRGCPLTDISPLQGMPLHTLDMMQCEGVKNFHPLTGAPLKTLSAANTTVPDLSFLTDAPLEFLMIQGPFTDLSVLQGKPLRHLELLADRLTDLSPLRGLPLESLRIVSCPLVRDLTPLLGLPALQKLAVRKVGKAIEPLRPHPGLRLISYDGRLELPVAEFWAEYDATQAAGKK